MDYESFLASLGAARPPADLGPALEALWWSRKGDWDAAHERAQAARDASGAWVHAHLHRVEGDESNAGYWYRRAGRPHADEALDREWETIARSLL